MSTSLAEKVFSALAVVLLVCLPSTGAAEDTPVAGDSLFAREFAQTRSPCLFGTEFVPHGQWRSGSTQRCYCNDGEWGQCQALCPGNCDSPAPVSSDAYPCAYMDTFGLSGARATITSRNCTCNGNNWACIDATPPVARGSCSVNGLLVAHGATYTCEIATCTCVNGAFEQCEPLTTTNAPCFAGTTRITHGGTHSVPGRVCSCYNGRFTQCVDVPQRADCYKDDVICRDGETTAIGGAMCSCDDGLLECREIPRTCVVGGVSIAHGSTFSDELRSCTCVNGELVRCERFDDSCDMDGSTVRHGATFTSATRRCLCRDGALINCVRLDNDCNVNGEVVPHGGIFSNEVRTCSCSNGILTNCVRLDNNCAVQGETIPNGATFTDDVQTCVCRNGALMECVRLDNDCSVNGQTVGHGATYTDDSRTCTCVNGELKNCVALDNVCIVNGVEVPHRERYVDEEQSCVCVNGELKNCVRLDNACVVDGVRVEHQGTWTGRSQSCTCINGALTNCIRTDSGCVVDNIFIRHGQTWTGDDRSCTCKNGELVDCEETTVDRSCPYLGDDIPHLVWVDIDGQRCQCVDSALSNCFDLCEAGLVEAMFIFDTSSSITENEDDKRVDSIGRKNWEDMRDFTSRVVEQVPFDTVQVGYSSFANSPSTEVGFDNPLSSNKNGLLRHLRSWYPRLNGNTRLGKALDHVRPMFSNKADTAKVILVLTDGQADDKMAPVAKELQDDGFLIYGVAVGNQVDYRQLMQLTGDRSRILWVDSFVNLEENLDFLKNAICV